MKTSTLKSVIAVVSAFTMASTTWGAWISTKTDINYDAYFSDFDTWSGDVVPGPADDASNRISGGYKLIVDTTENVTRLVLQSVDAVTYITTGSNITLGTAGSTRGWIQGQITAGATGTYLMDGGSLTLVNTGAAGNNALIDLAAASNTNTIFTQKGGTVTVYGTLFLTTNGAVLENATGTYNLEGGTLNLIANNDGAIHGGKSSGGAFVWTGGSLNVNDIGFNRINNNGTGNMTPGGNGAIGATILRDWASGFQYTQGSDAKMTLDIASATSYDQFLWTRAGSTDTSMYRSDNTVSLADQSTIAINVLEGAGLNVGDTFDMVVAADIALAGDLNIVGNGGLFSYELIEGSSADLTNDILRFTYQGIPEPAASAALLAGIALFAVARRRN